jgi:hypothetical protein
MWLGIVQDFVLGIPAIVWPVATLAFVGQRPAAEPAWVSFAATVLIALGAMYIPAALNPHKYRTIAWLAVLARPPGIIFFFFLYPGFYPLFGVIDSLLTAIQLSLLILCFYGTPKPVLTRLDASDTKAQPPLEYHGTSCNAIKSVLWSDPYASPPYHLGLGPIKLVTFFNHSARNLIDKRDLLPYFDKLIHANGICHYGVWKITEDSPYTGYFANGSCGLLIVRMSVAGLTVNSGTRRSFGIGGKIFPTMDPDEIVYPGNFVTVSHLSGLRTKHIVDIEMSNAPTIGLDPLANFVNRVVFRLMDTRPGFRQLHPISTLGVAPGEPVRTPDLMMLKVADDMPRIDAKDFREELRVRNYPNGKLIYSIFVRNIGEASWNRLGSMEFTEDVVSESGDKRLHFWIPRDVPDRFRDTRV